MKLSSLAEGLNTISISGPSDADVKGIAYDTRALRSGDLFVAVKGVHVDSHGFIADAIDKGASAIVHEAEIYAKAGIPIIKVGDSRLALARLSANFHGNPSHKLKLIGVTGTNGKTTTTRLIKSIMESAGYKTGLIGTINYMVGDKTYPAPHTTPEAPEFQGLLKEMLDAGCACCVSEVSSHALSQKRADASVFSSAVFTNLTREHLDFHIDMSGYYEAKRRLFKELLNGPAVVNIDDPYGRRLSCELDNVDVISYSTEREADLRAERISIAPNGLSFAIRYRGALMVIESGLIGMPNVYNILAACGAGFAMGLGQTAIQMGIKSVALVEGRFERVSMGQPFTCMIDYAHTEDALERLIKTARQFTKGRIITVFGCGGNRDKSKRPVMGRVASELSEAVVVTSDNPRSEDPETIITEIISGIRGSNYNVMPDRKEAIEFAVSMARDGDTVLIAGKGHEDYQEIGGRRMRFSDRETAAGAIGKMRKANINNG